jgi:hypothetical protein
VLNVEAPPIGQSLYDQWRDHFLANAAKAFEGQQQGRRETRLGREKARLGKLVGEPLLERNKNDELLG